MSRDKILLLRAGYHKEFAIKSLIEAGFDLIIVDEPNSTLLPFATKMYTINDIWDEQEMASIAIKAYKENNCVGAINFLDSSTIAYGKLSDYYNLNYYSEQIGRILANKIKVRDILSEHCLNSVKYASVHTLKELYSSVEKIGLPAVVKPSDRTASKGVIVLRTLADIELVYKESMSYSKNGNLIVEEYITGKEYCAELLIVNSKAYLMSVSEKTVTDSKYCVELRDITPARLSSEMYDSIYSYLSKISSVLHFNNGIVHIEFKIDNSEIKIIEINPRCAGGNLLESIYHLSGYNPYTNLANLVCRRNEKVIIPNIIQQGDKYTIFDEFYYDGEPGVIKSIHNTNKFNELQKFDMEKLFLYVDKGDYIENAKSNESGIGCLYLMDNNYEDLIERCDILERIIDIKVNAKAI